MLLTCICLLQVTKLDDLSPVIFLNRTKAALNCAAGSMQVLIILNYFGHTNYLTLLHTSDVLDKRMQSLPSQRSRRNFGEATTAAVAAMCRSCVRALTRFSLQLSLNSNLYSVNMFYVDIIGKYQYETLLGSINFT